MELLNITLILLTFGSIFYILYKWNKKENDRIEKTLTVLSQTVEKMFTSYEKTENKFFEIAGKIETEHFKQLEKLSDKNAKVFDRNVERFLSILEKKKEEEKKYQEELITKFTAPEENAIEQGQEEDSNPLQDLSPADFTNLKHFQFEGEEEIYPVSSS